MPILALVLFVAFVMLAGVARAMIQKRSNNDTGIRARASIPAQQRARPVLLLGTVLVGVAAPVAELLGLDAVPVLDQLGIRIAGAVLAGLTLVAVLAAQSAMGASWRNDVDPDESTELVTRGPFTVVRNPIFTATFAWVLGVTFVVPNFLALAGALVVGIGLELQVRRVEEPYLRRVHGRPYHEYAARTGRFLPGIGRVPTPDLDQSA
ncbi:isoprenylcysteine carboxylmethyltransferase family protein [Streptomyces sp. N2-109]|uniref:Isoprenylcysteine carboxylmethyltransferase family protein n=1 Tax=Streptomyces gossypii TaxID=2883101 RepID=A0ABT2JVV4_9ACTN|nr:isoprenylcysteine carboxylmethyltransferase family protein [Streptomyces gossypii]MCT2592037.1 isoprenylcysteine carboxylmethyltransferase family protein [Streptomyces gossypii]